MPIKTSSDHFIIFFQLESGFYFLFFHLFLLVKLLSHVQLFATLWTVAHQAPPSEANYLTVL